MSSNEKSVYERLMEHPEFRAEIEKRLIAAAASFREQGISEEEIPGRLKDYTVAFVKQFLRTVGKIDQNNAPTQTQSPDKKASLKNMGKSS